MPSRLAVIALFLAGTITTPVAQHAPLHVVRTLVDRTNAERARAGLSPLAANSRLMEAAQIQAEQMAAARQLAHELPRARHPRLPDRMAAVDYDWMAIGENVALGQRDAGEALAGWMKSRGHRANILNREFTQIGVGFEHDRNGRPYYVQVFARPQPR